MNTSSNPVFLLWKVYKLLLNFRIEHTSIMLPNSKLANVDKYYQFHILV